MSNKTTAAVCGLYCKACTIYIGTREDPARIEALSARFGVPAEELKCFCSRT